MKNLRLGIDVGGTNTDAVLMSGRTVIATIKRATTEDVSSGIMDAVSTLLTQASVKPEEIAIVMIGTTQFINALVQRKNLSQVAVVRVSLPKGDGVPPMVAWPEDLADVIGSHIYMVGGGSYYDGRDYFPTDEQAIADAARNIQKDGITSIAISANFSPVRPDLETRAAEIIREIMPGVDITLSADIGGLGLVDRENAAILNACLTTLSKKVVDSMVAAFKSLNIDAPIHLSSNDGTLISTAYAKQYPIFTCSAGPTNSIRGAAFLTGLEYAVIVDVGGTTTDIGFLNNGFPRETATVNYIGGVRNNFRLPDVLSIALGGGTIVRETENGVTLGPDSVGYKLTVDGRVFGGRILTTTDVAVRCGQVALGQKDLVSDIDDSLAIRVMDIIHEKIETAVDQMRTSNKDVSVVMVGGGSILVSRPLKGASQVLHPEHSGVANAIGAAIAQISGRVDKMYDYSKLPREEILEQAKQDARDSAIAQGAAPGTIQIIDIQELPMTHMQTSAVQIKVRAVGDLLIEGK